MVFANDNEAETPKDRLYREACAHVERSGRCSTSDLQRTFRLGYNRASRLVERMEREGFVSPPPGSIA